MTRRPRRKAAPDPAGDGAITFTPEDEATIRRTKELLAGAAADPDQELERWIEISHLLNRSTAYADELTQHTRGRTFVKLRQVWLQAAGFLDDPITRHKGTRSVLMKFANEPYTSMLRMFYATLDVHAKLHLRHPVSIFNRAVEHVAGPKRAAKQAAEREREQKAIEEAARAREQHEDDVAHVIAAIQLLTKRNQEITVETVAAALADPERFSPVLIGGILTDLRASGEYDEIVAKPKPQNDKDAGESDDDDEESDDDVDRTKQPPLIIDA
jgi:hypothetical protein